MKPSIQFNPVYYLFASLSSWFPSTTVTVPLFEALFAPTPAAWTSTTSPLSWRILAECLDNGNMWKFMETLWTSYGLSMFHTKNVVISGAVLHFQTNTCDNFKLKTTVYHIRCQAYCPPISGETITQYQYILLVFKNTHVPIYSTCKLLINSSLILTCPFFFVDSWRFNWNGHRSWVPTSSLLPMSCSFWRTFAPAAGKDDVMNSCAVQ